MNGLTTWLRKLRGAIGIGIFGSLSFVAFGSFVAVLWGLIYGDGPNLIRSLIPLAGSGFIAGLIASLAIAAGAREGKARTGWAYLTGVVLGEFLTFGYAWRMGAFPTSPMELSAVALTGFLLGSIIGILGAAAVKVAEHPGAVVFEEARSADEGELIDELAAPTPLDGHGQWDNERVPVERQERV